MSLFVDPMVRRGITATLKAGRPFTFHGIQFEPEDLVTTVKGTRKGCQPTYTYRAEDERLDDDRILERLKKDVEHADNVFCDHIKVWDERDPTEVFITIGLHYKDQQNGSGGGEE